MKASCLDYILSTFSIAVILILSFFLSLSVYRISHTCLDHFVPIPTLLFFIFAYGFLTAIYLRIVKQFFPIKTGNYTINHEQFTLWKLNTILSQLGIPCLRLFTPIFMRPILYLIYGLSIGKQTTIAGKILDPFITKLDDHVIIGEDSIICAHIMTYDNFYLLPVTIKNRATVGVRTIIMPGVEIGENSIILPGAVVTIKTQIPSNEIWGGIPARKIKNLDNTISSGVVA